MKAKLMKLAGGVVFGWGLYELSPGLGLMLVGAVLIAAGLEYEKHRANHGEGNR